ncbi:probable methyltransferase-like protein 24 isoform X1 [Hemicordylus capensis]|uniref:probable methyltransferase-like protein 24 isoform X1 n=1 Tax=Hemicordylus capensis TaxID=884348 RepID=UPI002302737E|nr:probable methyltransferase-like protein 24 isoform X1 [Hemicordylus capensis]
MSPTASCPSCCCAAKERRLGTGFAFRLCLLSVTLLLCLQLGLRRSWDAAAVAEHKPQLPPSSRRAGKVNEVSSRRQVTYIRSGRRRGAAEPTCCLQGAPRRRKTIRWHIDLQPWASPTPSLSNEALRLLQYISTAQISCDHMNVKDLPGNPDILKRPWSICLDDRFNLVHQIKSKQCRLYSLGLGGDDNQFEISMANSGCEVHRFDPSIKSAHIQEGQRLWYHRLSIDWRDPNPVIAAHKLHAHTKKLGTILNDFGHHKIDILKADMESAEWKILENLILEDIVGQIGQLVFEIHVHWPGFEVSGNDSTVVRYWYSLLKELELRDFRLFHTYKDSSKPQLFLKREAFNASSCYTLSWVNTRWK